MIKKESIEFAEIIYDGVICNKDFAGLAEANDGTIIDLATKELLTHVKSHGDWDGLDIVGYIARCQEKSDDPNYVPPLQSILHDYSNAISTTILEGMKFTKTIVVPQLEELYEELIAVYNKANAVSETPIVLEFLVTPEIYNDPNFRKTVQIVKPIITPWVDNELTNFLEAVMRLSAEDKAAILSTGCDEIGLTEKLGNEKLTVGDADYAISNMIANGLACEYKDYLLVLSMMTGIVLNPTYNLGNASTVNKTRAEEVIRISTAYNKFELTKIFNDLDRSHLVHTEYDSALLLGDKPTVIFVYADRLRELVGVETTALTHVIGGAITCGELKTLKASDLTPENTDRLVSKYLKTLVSLTNYQAATSIDRALVPILQFLNSRAGIDSNGGRFEEPIDMYEVRQLFRLASPETIEGILFNIAVTEITKKYREAKLAIKMINRINAEKLADEDVLFVVFCEIVTEFALEQLNIYREG